MMYQSSAKFTSPVKASVTLPSCAGSMRCQLAGSGVGDGVGVGVGAADTAAGEGDTAAMLLRGAAAHPASSRAAHNAADRVVFLFRMGRPPSHCWCCLHHTTAAAAMQAGAVLWVLSGAFVLDGARAYR